MVIYGINPVTEALRSGRVLKLRVADRNDRRLGDLLRLASERGVPVEQVPRDILTHSSGRGVHQGVVAELTATREWSVEDLVKEAGGVPLLVVLDGIEDPHNVGAILRSVDAAGAHGLVRQTRRAAPLSAAAAKTSAGALARVRVADVVNIARALEDLKAAGVWTVGLDADAALTYDRVDLTVATALVVGAEGQGLRRLVRERCDLLASIPMSGAAESLNASVAAGVVLFEAARQRRLATDGSLTGEASSPPRRGRRGEGEDR